MLVLDDWLTALWRAYVDVTPQAQRIVTLFEQRGQPVMSDHIALRTVSLPGWNIETMEPAFLDMGYQYVDDYIFEDKNLYARSYCHRSPDIPRIFISELLLHCLTSQHRALLMDSLQHSEAVLRKDPALFLSNRCWPLPSYDDYLSLANVSEYAAWLWVMGFRANHFTLSVNHLPDYHCVADVLDIIEQDAGCSINESGGRIKGQPDAGLVQGSTLADAIKLTFADGQSHAVPSCYYEVAQRFELQGKLYQGFQVASASHIFTSTDRQEEGV